MIKAVDVIRTIDVTLSRGIVLVDGAKTLVAIVQRFREMKLTNVLLLGKDFPR